MITLEIIRTNNKYINFTSYIHLPKNISACAIQKYKKNYIFTNFAILNFLNLLNSIFCKKKEVEIDRK